MKKKIVVHILLLTLFLFPLVGFTQDIESGDDVIQIIINITNFIWAVFMVITVIAFLVAGFFYITAAGDPTKVTRANKMVLYSIIGVAVALLSGGMVALIQSFLEV